MKLFFTKYAEEKLDVLANHKFPITQKQVEDTVEAPDQYDLELDPPKIIASKSLDKRHDLRVVYLVQDDIIKVITFYPAEK
jgi:hypothetical protein